MKTLLMFLSLLSIYIPTLTWAQDPYSMLSIKELETIAQRNHGLSLNRYTSAWETNQNEVIHTDVYKEFLVEFLEKAERNSLGKRYAPFEIQVRAENEFLGSSSLIGDYWESWSKVIVGHRSASRLIRKLKKRPLDDSVEADYLRKRERAVLIAINDYVHEIEYLGVTVGDIWWNIQEPSYFIREKLLQGLINLKSQIESGSESRTQVSIAETNSSEYATVDYNRLGPLDEIHLAIIISEYMKEIN